MGDPYPDWKKVTNTARCEFPNQNIRVDPRTFRAGEPVCIKNGLFSRRIYSGVYVRREGNRIVFRPHSHDDQLHGERDWGWGYIGKRDDTPEKLAKIVGEAKNLPQDTENIIRSFVGRSRRRKPKRKARKTRRAAP